MKENGIHKSFELGEAVKNKTTGQTMYVEVAWSPTVSCVYFDPEKDALVKVQMLPEDLERIKELLPYLPK
ncbi:hypothetical protein [Leptospira yasudae]|uniref:Uncharacterized protein n=1 Tax=Leptospira yasudae TaxID=2202201 RepID=A0A6N4QU40_9LEPT|nr:hypothetical protein [Leptospira yasudae]TGL73788.1 hypothetical protein EHQ72_18075 [Leptospira yasudae]TGL79372.1 hypothetical protein EHQ77_09960 [Leptospira yasudae]TGL85289.1 hypothetical protein EHQ83_08230 [Leptospira yasudae]